MARTFLPLLALLCALFAGAAFADNTADEADLAFQLGNDAYTKGNFNEALRNYFVSYRLVPNKNVLFNIARCYEQLEKFDEAYRYFNDLLGQDLPEEDRRDVQKSLQRIRPKVALIKVSSDPEGAEVFVDREDLGSRGKTPLYLAVPSGPHLIRVKKEGYHPAEATATLVKGREAQKSFNLSLIVGTVSFTGKPQGAWIKERPDGPTLATIPGDVSFPPGKRLLLVGASGFATSQYLVDVSPEGKTNITVDLAAEAVPTGKIIVTANRDNALIRVDGKDSGFTPTVLSLPEGDHTIELTYKDLRPHVEKVHIVRDSQEKLSVELRYAPPPVQAASKRLLSVDEAPASITVISSEELRAFGYLTLADALQAVRGIFISYDYQYQYVGVRGFSPPGDLNTRVLVLWDGHAMNDIWAGANYVGRDLIVDLTEVDRIEVVRGPGSALYGTGAFFAVINVVPRDRLDQPRNVEATVGVGGNSMAFGHLAASVGPDTDKAVTVSAAGLTASGAPITDLGALGVVRGDDHEKVYGGTARARYGDFTFQGTINHRDKEVPTAPFGTVIGQPGARTVDGRGFAEVRYDHDFGENSGFSARLYYDASRYDGHWPYDDGAGGVYTSNEAGGADWGGLEARLRLSPWKGDELTVGAEGQYQWHIYSQYVADASGTAQPVSTWQRALMSGYLLDEWRLHPRLTLSLGARVDHYQGLGSDTTNFTPVSPRLAIIARPYDGGLTKLVAGSAFRAPTVFEQYYNDRVSQVVANPLSPETIQTVEIEHSHDLTEEVRFTVSGYLNRIQHLVITTLQDGPAQCGDPSAPVQCLQNANISGTVQALGAEAEVRWQPGRFALVDLSYSYVQLRSIDTDFEITNLPNHLVAGRLMVPLVESAVRLSTQAIYQSARFSDRVPNGAGEGLLLNVGLSGERDHFRYFAGVTNALDVHYGLPVNDDHREPTVPQYGRMFLLQLSGTY